MADTVDLSKIEEFEDEKEELEDKIDKLVTMIREAKNLMLFTGAGISTSANIPDFRGPNGVWTNQARGVAPPTGVSLDQALPTACHMSIVGLERAGIMKYLVSQNVDGLHRRSGVSPDIMSELHGNSYLESCWKCGNEYLRDFVCRTAGGDGVCRECTARVPHFCHCTSRNCDGCGARLKDSIIHFKENLPERSLLRAFDFAANRADLVLVLGSSCRVFPACDIPKEVVANGGKMAIVNLQETGLDEQASLRLFARTDEVMTAVMAKLRLEVPLFNPAAAVAERTVDIRGAGSAVSRGEGCVQVCPSASCPHAAASCRAPPAPPAAADVVAKAVSAAAEGASPPPLVLDSGCAECGCLEVHVCATCHTLHCGRSDGGHMLEHARSSGHCIAASTADLSFWCYGASDGCHGCDSYVDQLLVPALRPLFSALHLAKFGQLPSLPPPVVDAAAAAAVAAAASAPTVDDAAAASAAAALDRMAAAEAKK